MSTPYYWLNSDTKLFLERGYLQKGQTTQERVKQIADAAERYMPIPGLANKIEAYVAHGWFSLSSPIWANFGLDRGLPISCFGSYIDDTMSSILYKTAEVGMMSKTGGGTSGYFGALRPRGAEISSGGSSNGPVHFAELFETVANVVSQSNVRRGSFAAYLPVEHPDILEFLRIRGDGHAIQHISIGVTITDDWMKSMLGGDVAKREVWAKIIQKRFESGYPYLMFTDNANKAAPQVYKDTGRKIVASNLCVIGTTRITIAIDRTGYNAHDVNIADFNEAWQRGFYAKTGAYVKTLVNDRVTYAEITASAKTGTAFELVKVSTSDDHILCTPEHKIYTKNRDFIPAGQLAKGDILSVCNKNVERAEQQYSEKRLLANAVEVYDITVPSTKSFLANNILVHNCNEIMLSSTPDESFVCDLSSMNVLHYDEWKNTDAVEVMTYMLDAVMSEFIEKASKIVFMESAVNFAVRQRALGIGVLGWHSYLQSKMIPFESMEAKILNTEIFKHIQKHSYAASKKLAELFGEPLMLKGYGLRNVTTMSVAPTVSSSFVLGQVSPSIEPENSNYYVKDLAKGKFTYRNPYLRKLLQDKNRDTAEVWSSILVMGGSVQHLKCLTQEEKAVFKTFGEISQKEIVIQAAARQKYIDQGQSLNLMIPPKASPKEVSQLLIFGWESGIKGFYYQRSANPAQELARSILTCASCEG